MSYVIAAPEMIAAAASDLAGIGSTLNVANAVAAAPTTGILVAAEDEVSAAIAALFSAHGQGFQALSAHAASFHDQFVQALSGSGSTYALAEAANVSPLQTVKQDLVAAQSTFNLGLGNQGTNNLGSGNIGVNIIGNGNTGNSNFGGGNGDFITQSSGNFASGNLGSNNIGS